MSSELAYENIEFNYKNQHIRCLAHVINLAAQKILITLKATANSDEDVFLNENNKQTIRETGGLIHKVNNFLVLFI